MGLRMNTKYCYTMFPFHCLPIDGSWLNLFIQKPSNCFQNASFFNIRHDSNIRQLVYSLPFRGTQDTPLGTPRHLQNLPQTIRSFMQHFGTLGQLL